MRDTTRTLSAITAFLMAVALFAVTACAGRTTPPPRTDVAPEIRKPAETPRDTTENVPIPTDELRATPPPPLEDEKRAKPPVLAEPAEEQPSEMRIAQAMPTPAPLMVTPETPQPKPQVQVKKAVGPSGATARPEPAPIDANRELRVSIAGRGEIPAGALVQVRPGDNLVLTVGIQDTGPRNPLGSTRNLPDQSVVCRIESRRVTNVDATGGIVEALAGDRIAWHAPRQPGLQTLSLEVGETAIFDDRDPATMLDPQRLGAAGEVQVMVLYPYDRQQTLIDGYPIGIYPNEESRAASYYVTQHVEKYHPPKWFIKVTPETARLHVSEHFTLGDFSSANAEQVDHFIALSPNLVKVLQAIQDAAQTAWGNEVSIDILRGYMSPMERQKLAQDGVDYTEFSRYQYGDGAAIAANFGGEGMGDLNRDGEINVADAQALGDLVDRVQKETGLTGWHKAFPAPIEKDWPQAPFVVFDLRDIAGR